MNRFFHAMEIADIWPEMSSSLAIGVKWFWASVIAYVMGTPKAIWAVAGLFAFNFLIAIFDEKRNLKPFIFRAWFTIMFVLVMSWVYHSMAAEIGLGDSFDIAAMLAGFYVVDETISMVTGLHETFGISIPPALLELLRKAKGITGTQRREIEAIELKQEMTVTVKEKDPIVKLE